MRPDLQRLLHARFPALYIRCSEPPSCSLMGNGFCVGDGWFPVIATLSEVVSTHDAACGRSPTEAAQVKEKFGRLRFYADGADDYARGAIACAEAMSVAFCDRCGKPARTHAFGGLRATVCRACVEAARDRYGSRIVEDEPTTNVVSVPRQIDASVIEPEALPVAWLRLLEIVVRDVLASQASLAQRPAIIVNASEIGGLLRIGLDRDDNDGAVRGAIDFVEALSAWVCRETGSLIVPLMDEADDDGRAP